MGFTQCVPPSHSAGFTVLHPRFTSWFTMRRAQTGRAELRGNKHKMVLHPQDEGVKLSACDYFGGKRVDEVYPPLLSYVAGALLSS